MLALPNEEKIFYLYIFHHCHRRHRRREDDHLRDALESMLKHRNVRVLVIDEAFHLLRFGNYAAVMDTLKSLADTTGVKLLLLGSYDLFDLVSNYGQVARRGEILHFERYYRDKAEDVTEFSESIVPKIQEHWPCEVVPAFATIPDELLEASLGCIGLLKAIMLQALSIQLEVDIVLIGYKPYSEPCKLV